MEITQETVTRFRDDFRRVQAEVGKVIVGHADIVEGVLLCLLAGGHALLEGVPGLGKTLLVRTLAQALDLPFSRVQFTPDLMPADITGSTLLSEDEHGRKRFEFQRGPLFAGLVLADEINRATPKTQSAMLEAMQEGAVTVGGVRHALPEPFFVLATQNPIEMDGTYPLPEAQLDRFLFKLLVPPPSLAEMSLILDRTTGTAVPGVSRVLTREQILAMRQIAREVPIAPHVREFAVRVVLATQPGGEGAPASVTQFVRYGSSPRGAQALVLAGKIRALLDGRYNVAFEDIASVAPAALRHRVLLGFEGQAEGVSTDTLLREILDRLLAQRRAAGA